MTYKAGSWNAICDVCSFKFKATEMQKRWDGLMVCSKDFEHDHPQKYLRVREDNTSVPWVRNRPADIFITSACDVWTSAAMADFGQADCARVGQNFTVQYFQELFYPQTRAVAFYAIAGRAIPGVY